MRLTASAAPALQLEASRLLLNLVIISRESVQVSLRQQAPLALPPLLLTHSGHVCSLPLAVLSPQQLILSSKAERLAGVLLQALGRAGQEAGVLLLRALLFLTVDARVALQCEEEGAFSLLTSTFLSVTQSPAALAAAQPDSPSAAAAARAASHGLQRRHAAETLKVTDTATTGRDG